MIFNLTSTRVTNGADTSTTTVTPDVLLKGYTAIDASGKLIVGVLEIANIPTTSVSAVLGAGKLGEMILGKEV